MNFQDCCIARRWCAMSLIRVLVQEEVDCAKIGDAFPYGKVNVMVCLIIFAVNSLYKTVCKCTWPNLRACRSNSTSPAVSYFASVGNKPPSPGWDYIWQLLSFFSITHFTICHYHNVSNRLPNLNVKSAFYFRKIISLATGCIRMACSLYCTFIYISIFITADFRSEVHDLGFHIFLEHVLCELVGGARRIDRTKWNSNQSNG